MCNADVVCQATGQHARHVIVQGVVAEVQHHQRFCNGKGGKRRIERRAPANGPFWQTLLSSTICGRQDAGDKAYHSV